MSSKINLINEKYCMVSHLKKTLVFVIQKLEKNEAMKGSVTLWGSYIHVVATEVGGRGEM